jgi:hypothetical protein
MDLLRNPRGFITILLIGLLVLACPTSQASTRSKHWTAKVKTSLKDVAIWEYIYVTEHDTYTKTISRLEAEGYQPPKAPYRVTIPRATASGFCVQGTRHGLDGKFHYDSRAGNVKAGPC